MDIDIGLAISNSWNKNKATVFVFAKTKSPPSTPFAVEAKKLGGKTGAEIAKMMGFGPLKPQTDLYVFTVKLPIDKSAITGMVKKSGIPFYPLSKGAKLDFAGYLRADEKHKPGYLRKKPADPLVWKTDDKRSPDYDPKAMMLIAQQGTLDAWTKQSKTILRVIATDRPDSDGKKGYFTLASYAKGKTPKQLEDILGFKSGTFAQGVKIFTAKTNDLSVSNVEFKGYTNTIGGKSSADMSKEDLEDLFKRYKFGTGAVQIDVTKPIAVKNVTPKKPLAYTDKLKI